MNKDTETFIASKELEQSIKDFNDSLILLLQTVGKSVESSKAMALKLEKASQHVLSIIKQS